MRSCLAAAIAALALAGCAGRGPAVPALPDRSDRDVAAEEQRLATLLARPPTVLSRQGTCRVRLLRRQGPVSWAWAVCTAPALGDAPEEGVSLPVRVDGTNVSRPADGAGYSESIERLFPADLARAVLDRDERVFP